jgi:5'-3' exoribonuclease 1
MLTSVITKDQQKILNQIRKFVTDHQRRPKAEHKLQFVNTFPTRDREFIQDLADSLHLVCIWDEVDDYGQPLVTLTFNMEEIDQQSSGEDEDGEWESDEESNVAIQRVFKKYDNAKVVDNYLEDMDESFEDMVDKKMIEWKRSYYKEKLEIDYDKPEELHPLIYRYVEGLQWVVHYYYKGVCSWGWFYNFHYAPKISDIKGIADFKFDLKLGKPFLPFQQLMGVLPSDSMEHVPTAYRDLMYEEASPILDFYPKTFGLDMNGKKADWEAVVKIPFIDEERLLRSMAARDHRLTPEEKKRNSSGIPATEFEWDPSGQETQYPSSLPGFFPDLVACRCIVQPFEMPKLSNDELVLRLMDGVNLGASALAGFPSLATLPYTGSLGFHSVNVFQQDSRNQSMVVTITGNHDKIKTEDLAKRLIGQRSFHSWPYLHEGLVTAVSDDMFKYELQQFGNSTKVISKPHDGFAAIKWKKDADRIEHHYSKRYGVLIGHVNVVLHVLPLKGLKRLDTGALVKDYDEPENEITQALQTAVHQVTFEDERYLEKDAPPMAQDFPIGEKVIFLGGIAYGTAAQVTHTGDKALDIGVAYFPGEQKGNTAFSRLVMSRPSSRYTPAHALARHLGLPSLSLSRMTSTLMVALSSGSKTNIGLGLKFESKGLKVLGYSRKEDRNWEFSDKAARLIAQYKAAFPEPFRHLDTRGGGIVTAAELCPTAENPDQVIRDMNKWLKTNGVADLEPVSLFAEQLEREAVQMIEQLSNQFKAAISKESIKRIQIKGIPRQAVLKPAHAIYRLQGQRFTLGDRVIMVQDASAGGVPLAMKGVVVGLGTRDIDVVWDVPFMGGETLGGRCSEYRGSTVPFTSCLNLTEQQFAVGSQSAPQSVGQAQPFQPQLGPRPVVAPKNYQPATAARNPPQILQNSRKGSQAQAQAQAQRGPMQYGSAAKGIKAPPPAPVITHQDRLQSALLGQAVPQAHPRQHTAKLPHFKPVSPTHTANTIPLPLPFLNGAPAPALANAAPVQIPAPAANGEGAPADAPAGRGGAGRGRGRGGAGRGGARGSSRGGPRGRGRGRGGASGAASAPSSAAASGSAPPSATGPASAPPTAQA